MWNIGPQFRKALREEHQFACKAVMLDTDFKEVKEITGGVKTNEISNFISDGSVDVDSTRGTRRTAELTLLNPTAEFTPARNNQKGWVGEIYINRAVRLYRGLFIGGDPVYVPVGTFMIDNAEIIVERNMSLVNLTMSDFWKKLNKSYADKAKTWDKGTPYGLIIREIITDTGSDYPYPPLVDELSGRDAANTKLSNKLTIDEGTSRGDFLKEQASKWDMDIYFNPMGQFVAEDRKKTSDKQVVWHFYSSDDGSGMLVNVRRAYNDDNLYNHVVVIGGAQDGIRKEQKDDNPNSELSINRIGDRVYMIKSEDLKTAAQVQAKLDKAWELHYSINEVMQCNVICNPALEADDVVAITEKAYSKTGVEANTDQGMPGNAYRLQRFNVPLVSSTQTIQMNNIWKEEDFKDYLTN